MMHTVDMWPQLQMELMGCAWEWMTAPCDLPPRWDCDQPDQSGLLPKHTCWHTCQHKRTPIHERADPHTRRPAWKMTTNNEHVTKTPRWACSLNPMSEPAGRPPQLVGGTCLPTQEGQACVPAGERWTQPNPQEWAADRMKGVLF